MNTILTISLILCLCIIVRLSLRLRKANRTIAHQTDLLAQAAAFIERSLDRSRENHELAGKALELAGRMEQHAELAEDKLNNQIFNISEN